MTSLGSIFSLPQSFFDSATASLPDAGRATSNVPALDLQEVKQRHAAAAVSDQEGKQGQGATCIACRIGVPGGLPQFSGPEEQRPHFRSDWHRYNVKRRLAGQEPVGEEAFDALLERDEVASISGSGSSDDDTGSSSQQQQQQQLRGGPRGAAPLFYFDAPASACAGPAGAATGGEGPQAPEEGRARRYAAVWRAALPPAGPAAGEGGGDDAAALHALRTLRARGCRWLLVLSSGGHFAAAVADVGSLKGAKRGGDEGVTLVAHKTFHRYVVRAKQGGRQSAKDKTGKYAKSAGSQLRRYNEAALEREVRELLESWAPLVAEADALFVHALSALNAAPLLSGPNAPLSAADARLRRLPFLVRRPTLGEVKRCVARLIQVYEVEAAPDHSAAAATEAATPDPARPAAMLSGPATDAGGVAVAGRHAGSGGGTPALEAERERQPAEVRSKPSAEAGGDGRGGELRSHPITVAEDREKGPPSRSKKKKLRQAAKKSQRRHGAAGEAGDVSDSDAEDQQAGNQAQGGKRGGKGRGQGAPGHGGATDEGGGGGGGMDDIDAALAEIAAASAAKERAKKGAARPQPPSAAAATEAEAARRRALAAEAAEKRMAVLQAAARKQQLW